MITQKNHFFDFRVIVSEGIYVRWFLWQYSYVSVDVVAIHRHLVPLVHPSSKCSKLLRIVVERRRDESLILDFPARVAGPRFFPPWPHAALDMLAAAFNMFCIAIQKRVTSAAL